MSMETLSLLPSRHVFKTLHRRQCRDLCRKLVRFLNTQEVVR